MYSTCFEKKKKKKSIQLGEGTPLHFVLCTLWFLRDPPDLPRTMGLDLALRRLFTQFLLISRLWRPVYTAQYGIHSRFKPLLVYFVLL